MATPDALKTHARFSIVERRMWRDVEGLSPMKPSGVGLWAYLLTSSYLGIMPGIIVAGASALAEDVGRWPMKAFLACFEELERLGRVRADWNARVVIMPKVLARTFDLLERKPPSPNTIVGWRRQWTEVPDCALKREYARLIWAAVAGLGPAYEAALARVIPRDDGGTPPASPAPTDPPMHGGMHGLNSDPQVGGSVSHVTADSSPNQDQDQDQDQHTQRARARDDEDRHGLWPGTISAEEVLALLSRSRPPLRYLATARVAREIAADAAMRPLTRDATVEAITAAQCKSAHLGVIDPESEDDMARLRDHVGGFIASQKVRSAVGGPRAAAAPSPAVEAFLRQWSTAWRAAKKQSYLATDEDRGHAAKVLEQAAQAARTEDVRTCRVDADLADRIVEHVIRAYLADIGENGYLSHANHPLRYLPRRMSSYGLPAKPRPPKAATPPDAPERQPTAEELEAGFRGLRLAASNGVAS